MPARESIVFRSLRPERSIVSQKVSSVSAPSKDEEEALFRATLEYIEAAPRAAELERSSTGFSDTPLVPSIDRTGGGWREPADDDEDEHSPFEALLPSVASRKIVRGSRGKFSYDIFNWGPRHIVCESHTEWMAFQVLIACSNDIISVEEQLPPIAFRDESDVECHHYFDFRITRSDGTRTAIAVKPEALVERTNFRQTLRLIGNATPKAFADRICLVTDDMLTPELRAYSAAIQSARHDALLRPKRTAEDDATADAVITTMLGGWTIGHLVKAIGLPDGRGYRAVLRAIADRRLSIPDGYLLEDDQFVRRLVPLRDDAASTDAVLTH